MKKLKVPEESLTKDKYDTTKLNKVETRFILFLKKKKKHNLLLTSMEKKLV